MADGETAQSRQCPASTAVSEEDRMRAGLYAVLARVLVAPVDVQFLDILKTLEGDDSRLGLALRAWADAARAASVDAIEVEYTKLFYGMGSGGEILPYASYYLTGSLHDRPLATLRGDMDRLGIAHGGKNSEPEDHLGFLLEMMHGLIVGAYGEDQPAAERQQRFFDTHVATWAADCFEDLEAAESADFYRRVAAVGRAFMEIEAQAFQMAA